MIRVMLDVESESLHGDAFAAGAVAMDEDGKVISVFYAACPPENANPWVKENVVHHCKPTRATKREVRDAFWSWWKGLGETELWSDCGWPVEAAFLAACVRDDPEAREFQGPYPLHDLATALRCRGLDPRAKYSRSFAEELPEHDPLADAHQSARLLRDLAWPRETPHKEPATRYPMKMKALVFRRRSPEEGGLYEGRREIWRLLGEMGPKELISSRPTGKILRFSRKVSSEALEDGLPVRPEEAVRFTSPEDFSVRLFVPQDGKKPVADSDEVMLVSEDWLPEKA